MKNFLIFTALLVTSQYSFALTKEENECLAKNVYFEARGLSKNDWKRTASVAVNRKKAFKRKSFGSISSNICDIVRSKEYATRKFVEKARIKEKKLYEDIRKTVKDITPVISSLYFTSKRGKHVYR